MLKMLQDFLVNQGLSIGLTNLLITIIGMAKLTAQNIIDFFEKKIDKSMLVKL